MRQPPRIGRGLGLEDADEDPAGGAVDGDKQVAPRVRRENSRPDCFLIRLTISHLRQILHVDVQIAGLVLRDD